MNQIDTKQRIANPGRIFGPDKEYICCDIDGLPGVFTKKAVMKAVSRGAKDPAAAVLGGEKTAWQKTKAFFTMNII